MNEDLVKQILQVEKLLDNRYKENKLNYYNKGKVHKKQMLFHKCKKRNRWVFGGNRSGKTECGAVECIWLARGIHPYKKNKKDVFGWVVSLSQQVQRDVAQAKILHYLPKSWIVDITMLSGRKDSPESGVIDQLKIKNAFGGVSTIGFKSCDQGKVSGVEPRLRLVRRRAAPRRLRRMSYARDGQKGGNLRHNDAPQRQDVYI